MHEQFEAPNPNFRKVVEEIFHKAEFITSVGIQLGEFGPGWCESSLVLESRHTQQDGFAHAGLVSTIADHTAGAAAGSLAPPGQAVLSIEFKINLLRPGVGESLFARAEVLRAGKRIIVSEASVFAVTGDTRKLVAKGTFTLAVVPNPH